MRPRRNKEYYAVVTGRVDEPTIFSSWYAESDRTKPPSMSADHFHGGDAHPRVTGCKAKHRSFFTLDEARDWMSKNVTGAWKESIKDVDGETTPLRNSTVYYAVAHGKKPGITEKWYGNTGALKEIDEISGACHKRFRTKSQALAFIEDWKESFAEVWRREVKNSLDQGFGPEDMTLDIKAVLLRKSTIDVVANSIAELRM